MPIRSSRWAGSQSLPDLDADDLIAAMSDDLLSDGDLRRALQRLLQRGVPGRDGQRAPGLQELLKQLSQRRRERLDRYDLGSALEDIKRKLEDVIRTEREGIRQRLAPQAAATKEAALDALPPDPAGRIRALQDYAFVDPEAHRLFEELLRSLRQQMLKPFLSGLQQALEGMTPADLARLREMLQDLNRMLRQKADGGEPDFHAFRDRRGQHFSGVESLDQLLQQIGRQMAQMQQLLASLSPDHRAQLEDTLRSLLLRDERLDAALAQLAMHLDALLPMDELRPRYDFSGGDEVTLQEAMRLMEELQQMDRLERQLGRAKGPEELATVDPAEVERLLGPEAARELERLRDLARMLEEAGYLERRGDRLELTARAIRKIADKALHDIFAHLKRDRFGRHAVERRGAGGDRTDETKGYEYGDPFLLDLKETLMNAVARGGPVTPERLAPDDFEVFRTELSTPAATVVMLDMSRSMLNSGLFLPAKKVALALHALIPGQFPPDHLHIVAFILYAREFTAEQLPRLSSSDW